MSTITVSQLRSWRPEGLNQAAADLRRAATRADEQRDALRGVWDKRLAPSWGGLAAHAGMEAAATQHETLLTLIDTLTGSAAVLVSAASAFGDAQRTLEAAVAMARDNDLTMTEDGQVSIDARVYSGLQQADTYALDAVENTAQQVSLMAQSALRAAGDADHMAATQLASATELVQGIRLAMGSSGTGTQAVELTPSQLSSLGKKVTDAAATDLGPNGPTAIAEWWQEHADGAAGDWSPVGKFVAGSSMAWSAAVFAPNLLSCTPGPGTTGSSGYLGSGFLIGPDGRKYPLVEPYVTGPDGKPINADVAASTEHDVTTLDGRDPGWHDLGTVVGSDKFGTVGTTTKILAGLGVAAGGPGPITTAQPAWLNGLSIGHGGYAVVTDTPGLARALRPAGEGHHRGQPGLPGRDHRRAGPDHHRRGAGEPGELRQPRHRRQRTGGRHQRAERRLGGRAPRRLADPRVPGDVPAERRRPGASVDALLPGGRQHADRRRLARPVLELRLGRLRRQARLLADEVPRPGPPGAAARPGQVRSRNPGPRLLASALLTLLVSACGSGSKPVASPASPTEPAATTACTPLHQFLVAGRLLGRQLQGIDPRDPAYVQRVLDTGVQALQQVKAEAPPPRATDADVQLRYWTAVRITLAGDGYDLAKISKAQDDALGGDATRLGSSGAADRLQAYAVDTCGQTVLPTAQQLQAFS